MTPDKQRRDRLDPVVAFVDTLASILVPCVRVPRLAAAISGKSKSFHDARSKRAPGWSVGPLGAPKKRIVNVCVCESNIFVDEASIGRVRLRGTEDLRGSSARARRSFDVRKEKGNDRTIASGRKSSLAKLVQKTEHVLVQLYINVYT